MINNIQIDDIVIYNKFIRKNELTYIEKHVSTIKDIYYWQCKGTSLYEMHNGDVIDHSCIITVKYMG